jgi:hypothetical protein
MRYINLCFVFLVLFISVSVPVAASGQGILLAGTELRLGMSKGFVQQQLEEKYGLTPSGQDGWIIVSKHGPPYDVIGTVSFKKNKLSWISKSWGSFKDESAVEFANELYSALAQMKGYSQGAVKVNTATVVAEPGLRVSEISFAVANRKVTILLTEGREDMGGRQVSIQESLTGP